MKISKIKSNLQACATQSNHNFYIYNRCMEMKIIVRGKQKSQFQSLTLFCSTWFKLLFSFFFIIIIMIISYIMVWSWSCRFWSIHGVLCGTCVLVICVSFEEIIFIHFSFCVIVLWDVVWLSIGCSKVIFSIPWTFLKRVCSNVRVVNVIVEEWLREDKLIRVSFFTFIFYYSFFFL
jgi:hypothetical protein